MKNKILDYTILTSNDAMSLEGKVKDAIADGWAPSGPLLSHKEMLSQAMLKFGS